MEFEVEKYPFKSEEFESRNLLVYFLIAFGWTWLMWIPFKSSRLIRACEYFLPTRTMVLENLPK